MFTQKEIVEKIKLCTAGILNEQEYVPVAEDGEIEKIVSSVADAINAEFAESGELQVSALECDNDFFGFTIKLTQDSSNLPIASNVEIFGWIFSKRFFLDQIINRVGIIFRYKNQ